MSWKENYSTISNDLTAALNKALEQNPVARRYLTLPRGLLKRALGALLRWQTLRKAGLDRCAQLLAGSAPCSEDLLQSFRELGIEIHNAYGLSEAPLVTLNRRGANRLGRSANPCPTRRSVWPRTAKYSCAGRR